MLKNRSSNAMSCVTCAAKYLCLPRDLNLETIENLNKSIMHYRNIEKGAHAFHAEDKMQHLFAVYSGSCKDYWVDEQGNERINNFYLPGDIIGLESIPERKHIYSLVALEDMQLCVIPIDDLFSLMQKHSDLLKRVMNISSYKMKNDKHVHLTTNANQRIADFILNILLRLDERNKQDDHFILSMSQIDISNYLGMAHETVNRIMRKFSEDKIIKLQNKTIYILDIERLKGIGTPVQNFGQISVNF